MKKALTLLLPALTALAASATPVDFGSIRHWTGTGPNRAALVVQYNSETYGDDAYVYGYRWENGENPTGEDMFKAICANSTRLSLLTQFTGQYGSTVCGIGYGLNQAPLKAVTFDFEKAKNFEFINFDYYAPGSGDIDYGQTSAPGDAAPDMAQDAIDAAKQASHVIQHPFDFRTYGYPAYDYDCWDIAPETPGIGNGTLDTKWKSAWYEGYWSYWTASSAEGEWQYSGTGFTGRRLSDGCIDGWSFTQFDAPQVGGIGEGTVPCEGGEIVYVPARLTASPVDHSKAQRIIGEGAHEIPVMIQFGDREKIDNIIYLLRFNDVLPKVQYIIGKLATADPLLSATLTNNEGKVWFDANSDGVFNNCDAEAEGSWTATEYEDAIVISAGEPVEPAYLFYLPAIEAEGVWVPDALTYNLSDNYDYIPLLVQPRAEHATLNYTWYRRSDDKPTHSSNESTIVSSVSTSATTFGRLTYKGDKTGKVYMHVRARIGNGSDYAYSNICEFTLTEPEIPIQTISFEHQTLACPLNSEIANAVSYTPANATYTGIKVATSDRTVATATGTKMPPVFKTTTKGGTATLTCSSALNPEITASFNIVSNLINPVEDIAIKGVEGDVITLNPKEMIGIIAEITPSNADIKDVNVTISDNGTGRDDYIATMYRVNYWDLNNNRTQFYELSGHRAGECKLTVTSTDGTNFSKEFTVKVTEPDRTPLENGYTDGTIILNEEWFGHTNGGLNYLTKDNEIIYQAYERENPGMSFGCTSQHGVIWGGYLMVASKQAQDGGDPLPGGGRFVIADAKTLKRLGSLDNLSWEGKSGDGRAVCGITATKVYVSASNGIYIIDITDPTNPAVTGVVSGMSTDTSDLYSNQVGDMVNAGKYVFALMQGKGLLAIDPETDKVVEVIDENAGAVTMTGDGTVWYAGATDGCMTLTPVKPGTIEKGDAVTFPAEVGIVSTGWGAWRTAALYGSPTDNDIYFMPGGASIVGGGTVYFRYTPGDDPATIKPFFNLGDVTGMTVMGEEVGQQAYGVARYDYRNDKFIVMTTHKGAASGQYRDNWTHVINPNDGSVIKTVTLRPYYWFQSLPIMPDTEVATLDKDYAGVAIDLAENRAFVEVDLSDIISDPDSYKALISFSLPAETAAESEIAEAKIEGNKLIVTPKNAGETNILINVVSSGLASTVSIPVKVTDSTSGLGNIGAEEGSIRAEGNRIYINGYCGKEFSLYSTAGHEMARFTADTDNYVAQFGIAPGIYLLHAEGVSVKIVIR